MKYTVITLINGFFLVDNIKNLPPVAILKIITSRFILEPSNT